MSLKNDLRILFRSEIQTFTLLIITEVIISFLFFYFNSFIRDYFNSFIVLPASFILIQVIFYYFMERKIIKQMLQNVSLDKELKNYYVKLDKLKDDLLTVSSIAKLTEKLNDFITAQFNIKKTFLLIWQEAEGAFLLYPEEDRKEKYLIFDPFIIWLAEHEFLFTRNDFIEHPINSDIADEALQFFNKTGADVIIPLILNQSLLGIILLQFKDNELKMNFMEYDKLNEIRSSILYSLSNIILYQRVNELIENLENKVKERTRKLEETQSQLFISEKMASLGTMVAGVAHEINTPAGVINASSDNLENFISSTFLNIEAGKLLQQNLLITRSIYFLLAYIIKKSKPLNLATVERFKLKKQLIQKFLNEGLDNQLSGEAANFLVDNNIPEKWKILLRIINLKPELLSYIKNMSGAINSIKHIKYAVKNIVRIVTALKTYSHINQVKFEETDIIAGIENTLVILQSAIKKGITIEKNYHEIPKIMGYPDELNQVWTNLFKNAFQAMKNNGRLTITTDTEKERIIVRVADTGPGIPKEIRHKIWDPFFTTKSTGEGSGLGLGIVKKIIEKHNGTIDLTSDSIMGTEFTIYFPVK